MLAAAAGYLPSAASMLALVSRRMPKVRSSPRWLASRGATTHYGMVSIHRGGTCCLAMAACHARAFLVHS